MSHFLILKKVKSKLMTMKNKALKSKAYRLAKNTLLALKATTKALLTYYKL